MNLSTCSFVAIVAKINLVKMSSLCPTVTLSKGVHMPLVGLGTWLADNEQELVDIIEKALENGYRHFDTAYIYGNEGALGKAFKKWIDSGKIRRDELFIVTKLPICGMKPEKVGHFMSKSLENLQLDYVDLYLIHVPFGVDSKSDDDPIPIKDGRVVIDPSTNLEEVWKSMEALVKEGKSKSIGVSNFDEKQLSRIVNISEISPSVLQVEAHVYFQQKHLRKICAGLGVRMCAYSPLGSGGRSQFYNSLGLTFEPIGLMDDQTIARISKKHGKTGAQICLRFLIQEGICVIPKTTNPSRLLENFHIFDFQLDPKDMKDIQNLDKGYDGRTLNFNFLPGIQAHPEFPKDML